MHVKLIQRKLYLDQLISIKKIPDIKIITKVRRSASPDSWNNIWSVLRGGWGRGAK